MKNKAFVKASIVTVLILLLICRDDLLPAQKTTSDSPKKKFGLFENEDIINISLRFDLTTYFRTKPRKDYLKATITFDPGREDSISNDVGLRTRGVFRNQFCMFAPIELNFKKADFGYKDLNKITKLKLVPQCSGGKDKEDYVLREYLAYKLFNVLTDTSLRVRLLTVTYYDSQKKKKPVVQYGFFIEPVDMLAARTNSVLVKSRTLNQKDIVPRIMDRLAIFNYMIGNYDWSVPGQHNILVLKTMVLDPYGLAIAIPHDFDWTGIVNASYAIPAEDVGTENVRQRVFRGICRTKEVYQKDLDLFLAKKDAFYKVINDFPYVTQKVKKDINGYLDSFFNQVEGRRDKIIYNLTNTCK
jgi:hypothetical protein